MELEQKSNLKFYNNGNFTEVISKSIVQIRKNGWYECSGIIYKKNYVITAAHCIIVNSFFGILFAIIENALSVFVDSHGKQFELKIDRIMLHPKYKVSIFDLVVPYDIGIIKLKDMEHDFGHEDYAIQLHRNDDLNDQTIATHFGWGQITDRWDPSGYLKEVNVMVINKDDCIQNKTNFKDAGNSIICVKKLNNDQNSNDGFCEGDSGGPLIYKNNYLIGIASFGVKICERYSSAGFTKISYFADWIDNITR